MIGVAKGIGDDIPGLVPFQTFDIDKDTLKLDNRKGRVSIIQLNGNHVWESRPCFVRFLKTSDDIVQRGGAPEVLLLQAQLFAAFEVVIWIQNGRYCFRTLLVTYRTLVFAIVELLKVEFA